MRLDQVSQGLGGVPALRDGDPEGVQDGRGSQWGSLERGPHCAKLGGQRGLGGRPLAAAAAAAAAAAFPLAHVDEFGVGGLVTVLSGFG